MTKKSLVFKYFEDYAQIPKTGGDTFVGILPKSISDVTVLFDALFDILLFPSYFGYNWNALSDCLRDFRWLKEKRVILVHEEIPQLLNDDLWQYLDVLHESIKDWGDDEDHKLIVMFPEATRKQIADTLDYQFGEEDFKRMIGDNE